ncbi:MAG TPA: 3-dehydroquinate synthase [Chloroflexota bacterium]|nr:3-dehydroquinate synthase [Chloroflexota bacterium]
MTATAAPASTSSGADVVFGDGVLSALGQRMAELGFTGRAFVVTHPEIAALHGGAALESLSEARFTPELAAVAAGESSKSLATAAELYAWLADLRAERRDTVVALGGGVIGDLAGFVAATYLRGMAWVQVPTTVLSQVDSSVGGKTAVNLPQGKNLVGAFHQARLTLIDVALLDSLPVRERDSGWAEVLKTALIFDPALFERLERTSQAELGRGDLLDVIERCVRRKMKIVAEDPTEKGIRVVLNFGHTVAHALEAVSRYGRYLHGEAVAIGMVAAAEISRRRGLIDRDLVERIEAALRLNELPVRYDPAVATPEQLLAAAASDKKSSGARLRWVLSAGLGETRVDGDVPEELVLDVLRGLAA